MKQAFFFIDDVLWTLRDLARTKPTSIFDVPYFKVLKKNHDMYGLTVQLNLFYRTDFFYGEDQFNLSEVPDTYKAEFEANAHWLKFAFHATQEFPDYPYVNADYEDVKIGYERAMNEVKRFAGEKSISNVIVPHWLPISKEGCQALADCGIKFLSCSVGDDVAEFEQEAANVPLSDRIRVLNNRKPETKIYTKDVGMWKEVSICAYNHLSEEKAATLRFKNVSMPDEETGINFKLFGGGCCLNNRKLEQIKERLEAIKDKEYVGIANHEQYFYPEYYRYQPEMEEKITTMAKMLYDFGFTFITCEDFK